MPPINIHRLRGRNGFDPPLEIPDDMAAEMLNVDLYEGQLGRKRNGTSADSMTFSSGGPFVNAIVSLIRHVPGQLETAMELWAFSADATPIVGRKAGGTTYSAPTLKDNITASTAHLINGVSFNGKLFFAGWDSTVNRAQVWDGTEVRRVGVGTSAAATVANTGAGTYPATIRYYKIAYTVQSGGVTLRRSELSPSVSFTPSGTGTHARITKPAGISEGETHWEVYASADNVSYYGPVFTTVVGTTTVDDNTTVSAYATSFSAAPIAGTNQVPGSARFVATDGNRVLWYGSLETAAGDAVEPKNGRVWFSALLGASATSIGDDERIPIQSTAGGLRYYIDIGENDGGEPRGLAGPLHGSMYAFQSQGITELTPTGRANTPYRRYQLSRTHGAVSQKSIIEAPDAAGNPCLYFLSPKDGPRRIGQHGLEWIGADVKDRWDLVDLDIAVVAHGVYHADLHQIWWWIATGGANPDDLLIFDITEGVSSFAEAAPAVRKGWTRYDGTVAVAWCSCMFSMTPGASMARRMVPFIGTTTGNQVLKCDTGTATVQAYITTKPYALGGLTHKGQVTGATLTAEPSTGTTISMDIVGDFGLSVKTADGVLLTGGGETRVVRRFEDASLADITTVHFSIGDASSLASVWTLDALTVVTEPKESRA